MFAFKIYLGLNKRHVVFVTPTIVIIIIIIVVVMIVFLAFLSFIIVVVVIAVGLVHNVRYIRQSVILRVKRTLGLMIGRRYAVADCGVELIGQLNILNVIAVMNHYVFDELGYLVPQVN